MRNTLIIIFLLYTAQINAQKKTSPDEANIDFSKFRTRQITLHKPTITVNAGCRFINIIIEDNRFDTSTLGFMHKGSVDNKSMIRLKSGFLNEIRNYLVQSIDRPTASSSSYNLICLIKKLWLSDEIYDEEEKKTMPKSSESGIIFRVEYLVEKENVYTPLYRFDTTLTGDKNVYRSGDNYIEEALTLSLSKLSTFTEAKIQQIKSKYTREQIGQYNQQRFNLPILKDSLQKGIYITFEEFKSNNPSVKEFSVTPGVKNDDIYIKDEKGNEIAVRNVYGYSDGKDIFIRSADNFFKLYRSGNSFNIWGTKALKKVHDLRLAESAVLMIGVASPTNSVMPGKTNNGYIYKLRSSPFQLDMETGNIY